MSIMRKLTILFLVNALFGAALPASAASLNMEFTAKIVAETCTFAATSTTFAFNNIYAGRIIRGISVKQDINVSSCTSTPQNIKFYLTPVGGSSVGKDIDGYDFLLPKESNRGFGFQTTLGFISSSGAVESYGNMPYSLANAITYNQTNILGKKLRLIAWLIPQQGKTAASDYALGEFSAAATLNIVYF